MTLAWNTLVVLGGGRDNVTIGASELLAYVQHLELCCCLRARRDGMAR
jgi:hypothetical protein